jgi:hypothetical protein
VAITDHGETTEAVRDQPKPLSFRVERLDKLRIAADASLSSHS